MTNEARERRAASHPLRAPASYTCDQHTASDEAPCAPPIRLDSGRRVPVRRPPPRERILEFLGSVAEARSCAIRSRLALPLPLYRVEALLRELARDGLVEHSDAHRPLHAGSRIRRHVVLWRLARPAGGEP